MIQLIGWLGAVLLAASGLPFAWSTYKAGRTDMSTVGVLLILLGMLGMFVFELGTARSLPQLTDFCVGALCWSTVLKYKLFPRE